ncbi:MAG: hypothetical protein M3N39_14985 [Pseudomonadota bacterium]|nr:hypothetical protein [Pseudomonadota bacterium]
MHLAQMRNHLLPVLLLAVPGSASAADLSLTTSANYSAGKYGGTEPTRATIASVGASATLGEWALSATLPYVTIDTGSSELTVGGVVVRGDEAASGIRGFGDVTLTAGRSLPFEWLPLDLNVQGQVKLPTGARSISTGKLDGGLDVELSKTLGFLSPFLSAGYRFYGDSADLELENGWAVSAGATLTFGKVTMIGSYDWSQSPIGLTSAEEIFAVASGPFGSHWSWTIYGSKGLNEGAADKMVGFGITRRFSSSGLPTPLLKSRREAEAALDQK